MTMVVRQYPLSPSRLHFVEMPAGAQVFTVRMHGGVPCLWAQVDENEARIQRRTFFIYKTDEEMVDSPMAYVGTFRVHGAYDASHVFEKVAQ